MPILRGRALRRYQREAPKELPGHAFMSIMYPTANGGLRCNTVPMPVDDIQNECQRQMQRFDRLPRAAREKLRNDPVGVYLL